MRLLRSMRWHWHEELVKPQDRWAEDKETWVGRSHLYSILIGRQKQGEGYKFSLRGISSLSQIGHWCVQRESPGRRREDRYQGRDQALSRATVSWLLF